MLFRKKKIVEQALSNVVARTTNTGFVFWNINDDLGHSSEVIMKSGPKVMMAYAYARRTAAASLYVQGLMNEDAFGHAAAMFNGVARMTSGDVEFQEEAADDASAFMQSYHFLITGMYERKILQIATEYEVDGARLSDAELFAHVTATIHAEQSGS